MKRVTLNALLPLLGLSAALAGFAPPSAASFAPPSPPAVFSGTFAQDDDVALNSFYIAVAGTYDIRSYGYGGGTLLDGTVIGPGGFDTELTLFDNEGFRIDFNDDGNDVNTDPNTGEQYDAQITRYLEVGDYQFAVTQFDNEPNGDLGDGFSRQGEGNFTPGLSSDCAAPAFCDVSGMAPFNERSNEWVVEISAVPLPAALPLFGSALLAFAWSERRRRRQP